MKFSSSLATLLVLLPALTSAIHVPRSSEAVNIVERQFGRQRQNGPSFSQGRFNGQQGQGRNGQNQGQQGQGGRNQGQQGQGQQGQGQGQQGGGQNQGQQGQGQGQQGQGQQGQDQQGGQNQGQQGQQGQGQQGQQGDQNQGQQGQGQQGQDQQGGQNQGQQGQNQGQQGQGQQGGQDQGQGQQNQDQQGGQNQGQQGQDQQGGQNQGQQGQGDQNQGQQGQGQGQQGGQDQGQQGQGQQGQDQQGGQNQDQQGQQGQDQQGQQGDQNQGQQGQDQNQGQNNDPQTSLTLLTELVAPGLAQDGQAVPVAGQVPSLTSVNNFIGFCFGKRITNGEQVREGSCNPVPMGDIIPQANMPAARFRFPKNFSTIPANQAFTVQLAIQNMNTGFFTNAQKTYYSAPQQLSNGIINGHSHVVIQLIQSLDSPEVLDPLTFAFFKGLNEPAQNGVLTATLDQGLQPGVYRMASINTNANHAPAIGAVAQHGFFDDISYFTVA